MVEVRCDKCDDIGYVDEWNDEASTYVEGWCDCEVGESMQNRDQWEMHESQQRQMEKG